MVSEGAAINATLRWGAKRFDVKVDLSAPPQEFKRVVAELTGVLPQKQRLLVKGAMIKVVFVVLLSQSAST